MTPSRTFAGFTPGTKSFAWKARGLGAIAVMAGLVPFLMLQSLVSVLKNGLDIWLASLLPVIGIGGAVGGLIALAALRPRRMLFDLLDGLGWASVAAYFAGIALDLLIMSGAVPRVSRDLSFVNVVNIVEWLAISPLVWLNLKGLRLRPT